MSINDRPALRILVVYEGLIATPWDGDTPGSASLRMRVAPKRALRRWVTDARMAVRLRDADDFSPYVPDVITFYGRRAAEAIEERMEHEHVAFGQMLYEDDPRALSDMSVEHLAVYHSMESYKGLLGDGEIYLWNPGNFDLPAT